MSRRIHINRPASFRTAEDLEAFLAGCDEYEGQGVREPEWAEHEAVIEQSRRQGFAAAVIFVDTSVFMDAVGDRSAVETTPATGCAGRERAPSTGHPG